MMAGENGSNGLLSLNLSRALLLTLSLFLLPIHSARASANSEQDFIKKGYFNLLNFNDPKELSQIPGFESWLITEADTQMKSAHPNALMLSYTAMYLVNTDDGVSKGKISYSDLTRFQQFSEEKTLAAEIDARNAQILVWLSRALEISPDDDRIQSWKTGQEIRIAKGAGFDQMLSNAENSQGVFPPVSAIITSIEYQLTPAQKERVFKIVQRMTSKDRPCKSKEEAKTKACAGSSLVPYSHQASVAMLSDQLLRRAVETGNKDKSLSITALSMDFSVTFSAFLDTLRWPLKKILPEQRKVAARLMLGQKAGMNDPYFGSEHQKEIYQCSSCHEGGKL